MDFKIPMRIPPFFAELAKSLAGDIDCSLSSLTTYSRDDSPYQVTPQAIIYPKNRNDIKSIISFAKEYSVPLTVCGARLSGAGGTLGEGIIIDLTKYCTTLHPLSIMDNTITVEAGVTVGALAATLSAHNMELPILFGEDEKTSVGGLVATRSVNPSSFYYGSVREWIEGLTIIVDTGEEHHLRDGITPSGRLLGIYQSIFPLLSEASPIIRAGKPENKDDATGYAIWGTSIGPRQLVDEVTGSEGTLGIITSVTFRVAPKVLHRVTTKITAPNALTLTRYADQAKAHGSTALFMYDSTYSSLITRFSPEYLTTTSDHPYTLLVTHRDNDIQKLHARVRMYERACNIPEGNAETFSNDTADLITSHAFHAKTLQAYTRGAHTLISHGNGIVVPHAHYVACLEELDQYMVHDGRVYTLQGSVGSHHISLHVLFDQKSQDYEKDLLRFTRDIFLIAQKHKGGISALGGDGLSRTPYLSLMYNEDICALFKKIKTSWDPHHLFNPSKKTTLSTTYLHNHLRRD